MPPLPENVLLRMAWEAAEGLMQWHTLDMIHPDVAASSFMVTGDMIVVIGDYGTNSHTYKDDLMHLGDQAIPTRWCAPECFHVASATQLATIAGNIWSFGVVLWEILTLGCRPYATLTDEQVVQQVLQEKRAVLNPPSLTFVSAGSSTR